MFHGVSAEADFSNYFRSFESTMTQFARLTDPSKINVVPERVMVRSVKRTATLAEAFREIGVPQQKMNEFALLNNLELTDRIEAGRLIKIVGK